MKKIAIHSAPRSGSTWMGSIFDSNENVAYRLQPLFSYTHKSQLTHSSTKNDIDTFFDDILHTKDSFVLQKDAIAKKIVPEFAKTNITHVVYKEVRYHNILKNLLTQDKEIKIIGIVRNPNAVIHSWLRAPKEFKKELGWDVLEEWRYAPKKNLGKEEEFNGFEKWKEVVDIFVELKQMYPDRFLLIKYDDLLKETVETVKQIFSFCELEFGPQTVDFLNSSKKEDKYDEAYSVYRVKKNDNKWIGELPLVIQEEIAQDLENTKYSEYL